MPKSLILSLLIFFSMLAEPALAEERAPAGYVVDMELTGADADARTVVVRKGAELEAKLMMPLYDGDVVFVREPESTVVLELGPEQQVTVGGDAPRFGVEGELPTGDSGWDLLSAVAGVFAGEGEQAPENMVSKGGGLKVPMAVRGTNFVLAHRNLWLAWQGGKQPYMVSLKTSEQEVLLAKDIQETSGTFALAAEDEPLPERFSLIIRDGEQQKVEIRFRQGKPSALSAKVEGAAGKVTGRLMFAAALTALEDGAWSVEAAQQAGRIKGGDLLRRRIAEGWRFDPSP